MGNLKRDLLLSGLLLLVGCGMVRLAGCAAVYGTPAEIVVVEDTAAITNLPQAELAILASPSLRQAAAQRGVALYQVDAAAVGPDVPRWAISAAAGRSLPAWVLRDRAGNVRCVPCPRTEAEALRLIGG